MQHVFQGFQERNLPLSVLTLDADFMDGYRTLTVDSSRYPDLPGLASRLAQAGIHLVGSVNPGVKHEQGLELYERGRQADIYCKTPDGKPVVAVVWPGYVVYPDFTRAEVRQWWGDEYAGLLNLGLNGFWHDMNEPECFVAWGESTLPRCILMTSLATVFGLLPMAIGWGTGGETNAPLARSVVGGLSVSTLLTLFLVPTMYMMFAEWHPRKFEKEQPAAAPLATTSPLPAMESPSAL